ncbi:Protein phosphatase 2C [Diplonema papillatum]|nr:Protein phosphatase 2C [Diplonema papillatum]
MGAILPKPVTTKVLERQTTKRFHMGLAFMNGYREKMEDAHTIFSKDDWGFFGVFDGHCGPNCSVYVADRFKDVMDKTTIPMPDEQLKDLSLTIDKEFIDQGVEGGSTGTYMIVSASETGYHLQVANVGDSRIVLLKRSALTNGEERCVSLTTDHKPAQAEERRRIEAAGGHVANNRVDGSLAVSRAFGDASYKSKCALTSKVIAVPDIVHHDAQEGDVVLLCCDGVFENDAFSNPNVIDFIAERLILKQDLATIAAAIVDEAMARGSKDNISAMLVQLGGELDCPESKPEHEVLAGPFSAPFSTKFCAAYNHMAGEAQLTPPQCLELRFDQVTAALKKRKEQTQCTEKGCDFEALQLPELEKLAEKSQACASRENGKAEYVVALKEAQLSDPSTDLRPLDVIEMENELKALAVPEDIAKASPSPARTQWFADWISRETSKSTEPQQDANTLNKAVQIHNKFGLPIELIFTLLSQSSEKEGQPPAI